jgi:hypothetical protein
MFFVRLSQRCRVKSFFWPIKSERWLKWMSCPKWIGSPRPPSSFQTLKRSSKKKSIKDFITVAYREEFPLRYRQEEQRRKGAVCWNLLCVPTVVRPDPHRRMSLDHPPREIVTLPRWPTRIYKSLVRANRLLPQLCKRQGQEGTIWGRMGGDVY